MKRTFALLAIAVLATAAFAQNFPGPPSPANMAQHRVEFLTTLLSLTAAQQTQATTIFANAATAQSSVHQSMQAAHDALKAAVTANNSAGIDAAASTIGNLTAQSIASESKADAALYQILTPEQQTKLSQFESQHRRMGFGPGERGGLHARHGGAPPQQ